MSDAAPKNLVFCIGFNKCGTTSLHNLFRKSGMRSLHCVDQHNRRLAQVVLNNLALGRRTMAGSETFQAFSDISLTSASLNIEGCRFYRQFEADYPDAHFILNTRDCENWIQSRLRHNRYNSHQTMIDRVTALYGLAEDEIVARWRDLFHRHHEEVRAHFAGHPRFLEFDIEIGDPVALRDFLAPSHAIAPRHWSRANSTEVQRKNKALRKLL